MKVLLDTPTFLWGNTNDPAMSGHAREIIADGKNEIFLSAASVWEIVIKAGKGRLVLPESPAFYITSRMSYYRFRSLPVQISHLWAVQHTSLIRRDHLHLDAHVGSELLPQAAQSLVDHSKNGGAAPASWEKEPSGVYQGRYD